jgi:long-chain acyl-CoA synthetase
MPRVKPPERDPRYPDFPTVVHALAHAAAHRGDAPALACVDRVITYAQYARAVAALARRFGEAGAAGERIAYLMRNGLDTVVALYAGLAARAQIAPLNPTYTDREIEPLVRDVDPRLIVCDPEFAERARTLAQLVGGAKVIVAGADDLTLDRLLAYPAGLLPLPEQDDLCALFFTGGTTGLPKGAEHRHRNLMAYCYSVAALWPLPLDQERILNVAPLFHIWGFCFTLIFPVYLRALTVLLPAYKPAAVLEEFQKRGITTFAGGPAALYMGLRANENFSKTDFASLRVCLSGGAACPVELIHSWERTTGSILLEGLGHVGGRANSFKSAQRRAQDRLGGHRGCRLRSRGSRS